jgi:hypothetical protein
MIHVCLTRRIANFPATPALIGPDAASRIGARNRVPGSLVTPRWHPPDRGSGSLEAKHEVARTRSETQFAASGESEERPPGITLISATPRLYIDYGLVRRSIT